MSTNDEFAKDLLGRIESELAPLESFMQDLAHVLEKQLALLEEPMSDAVRDHLINQAMLAEQLLERGERLTALGGGDSYYAIGLLDGIITLLGGRSADLLTTIRNTTPRTTP